MSAVAVSSTFHASSCPATTISRDRRVIRAPEAGAPSASSARPGWRPRVFSLSVEVPVHPENHAPSKAGSTATRTGKSSRRMGLPGSRNRQVREAGQGKHLQVELDHPVFAAIGPHDVAHLLAEVLDGALEPAHPPRGHAHGDGGDIAVDMRYRCEGF